MGISTAHADNLNDAHWQTGSVETQMWLALFTTDPGTTGASGEVSGGAYARIRVYVDGTTTPHFGVSASGEASNAQVITFAEGGGGAVVTHVGWFDASTAGNFLRGTALDNSFTYSATTTPEFAAGSLVTAYV